MKCQIDDLIVKKTLPVGCFSLQRRDISGARKSSKNLLLVPGQIFESRLSSSTEVRERVVLSEH